MVGQASVSTEWTSSDALSIGPAGLAQIRRGSVQQTDDLTVATVEEEVESAEGFQPALSEYLVMTTAARDAQLQQEVRRRIFPGPPTYLPHLNLCD